MKNYVSALRPSPFTDRSHTHCTGVMVHTYMRTNLYWWCVRRTCRMQYIVLYTFCVLLGLCTYVPVRFYMLVGSGTGSLTYMVTGMFSRCVPSLVHIKVLCVYSGTCTRGPQYILQYLICTGFLVVLGTYVVEYYVLHGSTRLRTAVPSTELASQKPARYPTRRGSHNN
jgi:hypothetical protein